MLYHCSHSLCQPPPPPPPPMQQPCRAKMKALCCSTESPCLHHLCIPPTPLHRWGHTGGEDGEIKRKGEDNRKRREEEKESREMRGGWNPRLNNEAWESRFQARELPSAPVLGLWWNRDEVGDAVKISVFPTTIPAVLPKKVVPAGSKAIPLALIHSSPAPLSSLFTL